MVSVSASVNRPLHHKVQKFSSGTGSPGCPGKRAVKWLWCGGVSQFQDLVSYFTQFLRNLNWKQTQLNLAATWQFTAPRLEKRCHYTFASEFAKCYPIFKILSPTHLAVNFLYSKTIRPYLKHVNKLPCEMFMLKNQHAPELSEAKARLSHLKQLLKNIHTTTLELFLFTNERYLQWPCQKIQKWLTVNSCSNQEERRHDKTPVYMINVQSLMASVSESHKWLTIHQFDTCQSQSQG